MCIIAAKKRGVALPANIQQIIQSCWWTNNDGAGWMLKRAGEKTISYQKGFMAINDFLASFRNLNVGVDDEFVMHFRIRTHGKRDEAMTHPFVVSRKTEDLTSLKGTNIKKMVICHNGIFSGVGFDDKLSDTALFARDFLSDYYLYKGKRKLKKWRGKIKKLIGHQKLCIMHPEEDLELLGSFIYSQGMIYSNSGYKMYRGSDYSHNGRRSNYADTSEIEGSCYGVHGCYD